MHNTYFIDIPGTDTHQTQTFARHGHRHLSEADITDRGGHHRTTTFWFKTSPASGVRSKELRGKIDEIQNAMASGLQGPRKLNW